MKQHPKLTFEYNKITDYIYIGTNQCCQIHFKKELLGKGIKADISLEKERLDAPFGVDYYLWLPVKDHTAPSQKQLIIGVNFIENLIKNKIKVYVHCQRGHGRAPTLVAAYLISKGKTVKQAISLIKKKRSVIHPNKIQINVLKRSKAKWQK
ncbi:dual specificity protein phosphatase family protein [Candidatus Woesearchaeota archaeon]|nr:dual specificity protein phosphatase family protein [Candidatus Woesearchaeota archaeon]